MISKKQIEIDRPKSYFNRMFYLYDDDTEEYHYLEVTDYTLGLEYSALPLSSDPNKADEIIVVSFKNKIKGAGTHIALINDTLQLLYSIQEVNENKQKGYYILKGKR